MKAKIKSHDDEVTDFYDKEIPKVDSNHVCLAGISLDSALKKDENSQVFLKECKYTEKRVSSQIKWVESYFLVYSSLIKLLIK